MNKILLIALVFNGIHAVQDLVYFGSILNDNNKKLAQAFIEGISSNDDKDTAIFLFKGKFKEDYKPVAGSGLSLEDRKKLIEQASGPLRDFLAGKDLSKDADLQEVMAFIGSPKGSGGMLAQQLGAKADAAVDALAQNMKKSAIKK
jgi:hypothetical protein